MAFPNLNGRPRKYDHKDIVEYWLAARKNNPNYTKAACARVFRIHHDYLARILKAAGVGG